MSQIQSFGGSGGSGGSGIQTIDGDIGSITGSTVTIYADNADLNCGSTVLFDNSGTVSTLNVTDSNSNTLLGNGSGNLSLSGQGNVGVGTGNMKNITSATYNSSIGWNALESIQTGTANCAIGDNAGRGIVTGSYNTCLGSNSQANGDGSYNISVGVNALNINSGNNNSCVGSYPTMPLSTGNNNCFFGYNAGLNYTGAESSNIILMNAGVLGESNVMRLGTDGSSDGQVSSTYIAGVNGVTTGSPQMVTLDSVTLQWGVAVVPSAGISQIDGDSGSITGSEVTISANQASLNSGSSVAFVNSGTVSTLNLSDSGGNTILGVNNGNLTLGSSAGNVSVGSFNLSALTGGSNNIAIGTLNLSSLLTGSGNIVLGNDSGSGYTGAESNNVLINSAGVAGDASVIRIGDSGAASECFIGGIVETTPPTGEFSLVYVNTNDQLQSSPSLITAPSPSSDSTLTFGSAYQNTTGSDILLTVYLASTTSSTVVISCGVGPSNTPTQQTIVSTGALIANSVITIPIYIPSGYYALLSYTSASGSIVIAGQQAMPI